MNNIKDHDVIIIGATNMLSGLDPALKRSGRFDWKIPIFPPNAEERASLFKHYLHLTFQQCNHIMNISNELNEADYFLLGKKSKGFTSSDIELVCSEIKQAILLEELTGICNLQDVLRLVKQRRNQGLFMSDEDVRSFIDECIHLNVSSSKIDFLIEEWGIKDAALITR